MKYAVMLPSKDRLTIGPFINYQEAAAWLERSIFSHEPYEIIGIIEPRPDHRRGQSRYFPAARTT